MAHVEIPVSQEMDSESHPASDHPELHQLSQAMEGVSPSLREKVGKWWAQVELTRLMNHENWFQAQRQQALDEVKLHHDIVFAKPDADVDEEQGDDVSQLPPSPSFGDQHHYHYDPNARQQPQQPAPAKSSLLKDVLKVGMGMAGAGLIGGGIAGYNVLSSRIEEMKAQPPAAPAEITAPNMQIEFVGGEPIADDQ